MKDAEVKRHTHWVDVALLAGATALFFWPLWVAGYRFPSGGGDLWGQLYAVWSFVAEWVHRGVFSLWSHCIMGGDPILAEGQYGLFNPLNWPLFLFHPIPVWLVLLRGAFTFWLAGAGTYLYLRRSPVWRVGRAGAMVGAVAYMLSDPFIAHLGHPQFNDAMAWLPWALWGVDGVVRRRWAIAPSAVALALILLSGHGQASFYAALAVAGYALWQVMEGGPQRGPRRLGRLALVGVTAVALAAPAILPGMERLPFTERALVPWELRRGYEFIPAMLIDFLSPAFHGRGVHGFWPSWNRVESAYVGAVALCLASLGLLGGLHRRRTWALIVLGVTAYDFALGYQGILYPRLAHLPFFAESWKTSRAIFLLAFALAVAAALGVERLRRGPRWACFVWMAGLVAVGAFVVLKAPVWAADVPAGVHRQRALTGLCFAALLIWGTALLGWVVSVGRWWGRAALLLLLLAELVALGALVEVEPSPAAEGAHAAAVAFMQADTGWFRVDVDAEALGLWPPAALLPLGFEVAQGTGNPMELAFYNHLYWSIPYKTSPLYRILGVKYIVVPKGAPPGGEGIWPVFIEDPLVDIHLHTGAMTRAWLVYRTVPVEGFDEAYALLSDPAFAPELVATVEDGPALDEGGGGRLEVMAYGPNRVAMGIHTSTSAFLVLSDIVYPGWEAWLDGEPVPIYRTDGIFRGVFIPPGEHRLEMRFFPRSFRLGVGMAAMAVWVLVVLSSLAIVLGSRSRSHLLLERKG